VPPLVNANAQILCAHAGKVTIIPKQTMVLAGGAPVLRASDLAGSVIVGCAIPPSPGSKPGLAVISVAPIPGSTVSAKVLVMGEPPLIAAGAPWTAATDCVPPTPLLNVVSPGQMTVQA
jgi:hypothetical protein